MSEERFGLQKRDLRDIHCQMLNHHFFSFLLPTVLMYEKYDSCKPVNFFVFKNVRLELFLNVEKTTFSVCSFVALNWVPESYVNRFPLTYNSNTPENLTPL